MGICTAGGVGGWALMAVVWVAVVGLVVWAVCRMFPERRDPGARALLDARLASGEIDLDTYRRLRDELAATATATAAAKGSL